MNKLRRIRWVWHRLYFSLCLAGLSLINYFVSRRARIHWVGGYRRRRRPERAIFATLFLGSLVWGAQQYIFWSTLWGGMLSIFLNLFMLYQVFPRKRYHWVR